MENGSKPEGALLSYQYRRSDMRISPSVYYLVEPSEKGGVQLTWAKNASDGTVIRVEDDALVKIDALMWQYKLYRLKENYRPLAHVLDGTMWSVRFRYGNGTVYSGGDNAWPGTNLKAGIDAVNAYIDSLIDAAVEADIIGTVDRMDL